MIHTTVLERGRILRGADEERVYARGTPTRRELHPRLYDRLHRSEAAREDRGEAPVLQLRRRDMLVGSWVGVLQIAGLQLEILPKTDEREPSADDADPVVRDTRANLMEMLVRGGFGVVRSRGLADLAVDRGSLHDRLIDAFLDRVLEELRRGLDRGYLSEEDNLPTLRGKLVFGRHVVRNAAQKHRFFCRHDRLTEETTISLRLKQACQVLARRPLPPAVAVKCQQALAILDDVPDVAHVGPEPTFTRQNQRFEDVYVFACVILRGQTPEARAGEVETFSLLFDMEKVFERYLAAFLHRHVVPLIDGTRLHAQARGQSVGLYEADGRHVLRLKPDLLFVREPNGADPRRLVIDTKWKRLADASRGRPNNADLYQLYAYLRRYECETAYLLYPKVSGAERRDLNALAARDERVGQVGVRFVDLGGKRLWTTSGREALKLELLELVREGLGVDGDAISA